MNTIDTTGCETPSTDAEPTWKDLRQENDLIAHFDDYAKIQRTVMKLIAIYQPRLHPHMILEHKDVASDLMLKWLVNGYLDRYDPECSSPTHYLRVAVKNHLISAERAACAKKRGDNFTVSGDREVVSDPDDPRTLFDTLPDHRPLCALDQAVLNDCLERLSRGHSWGNVAVSPLTGEEMQLSHYSVVYHTLAGYSVAEVAKMYRISRNRAHVIYDTALQQMRAES